MKKLLSLALMAFFISQFGNAQSLFKIGATGGLLNTNTNVNISALGFNIADIEAINETGFYVGAIADIGLTESLHIQPELTYAAAGDLSFVMLPIMAKFYVFEGLNIQAGPQFNFSNNLNEIKNEIKSITGIIGAGGDIDDVIKSTTVDLGFGAGYDITDNIAVQARYAFALTNRYDGPLNNSLDIKTATLNVGVAYFF